MTYTLEEIDVKMSPQTTLYLGYMNGNHKLTISNVVFYVEDCCREKLTKHIDLLNRQRRIYHSPERIADAQLTGRRTKLYNGCRDVPQSQECSLGAL